jgi:CheY-like chemotaxis protein
MAPVDCARFGTIRRPWSCSTSISRGSAASRSSKPSGLSATSDESLAQRALAYGAFDYVPKPLNLPYLAGSLEAAIMMQQAGL